MEVVMEVAMEWNGSGDDRDGGESSNGNNIGDGDGDVRMVVLEGS